MTEPLVSPLGPKSVVVILGTRPEIIKLAELISLLGSRALLIHTGQHWDHDMSGSFMSALKLPAPDVRLSIGGGDRATQIAQTLMGVAPLLSTQDHRVVVVQGDTNTVLGGALAANAVGIPLVHVESGLRSGDRRMPEEHNRVLTDHAADLCLAPTEHNHQMLLSEGIPEERIVVTGNTVVAAVQSALTAGVSAAHARLARLGFVADRYILATIHRPENTDDKSRFGAALRSLSEIARTVCPVLLPLHPRARARISEMGLESEISRLTVVEPLGYEEFAGLASRAALMISDSGGVQEEASVWKRPVLVLRRSTERPEGLGVFSELVTAGTPLVTRAHEMYQRRAEIAHDLQTQPSPYGDEHAAQRCLTAIEAVARPSR